MLTTYCAALCFVLAALLAGQGVAGLTGRREGWSVAPAVGLGALLCVGALAGRLPGRELLIALVPGLALLAAAVVVVLRRPPWPPLPALCAAGLALVVSALPFYVSGSSGLLGVSLNNDTSIHLVWAEALRSDLMAELYPLPGGYPIAPHALMAAVAAATGIAMDEVLNGLLIATAALTALAAWPLLARLPVVARSAGAVLVAFAYLSAAYFAQGAFKETMMALFVVAFVAVLAEARGARRPWLEVGVPAGLCAAAGVQVYSYLALGWFVAITAAWLVLELALGGRRDVRGRVREALPAVGPPVVAAAVVLVAGIASQADRLVSFAGLFSVSPAGAARGIPVEDIGNLVGALSPYEGLGVWPSPDFRFVPENAFHAGELAAVALLVVLVGVVVALRRREAVLVAAVAAAMGIFWISDRTQSPYLAAKALALASPLVMALALGVWPAGERRGRIDGTLARLALLGVFTLGAAYSTSLALRAAPVASQAQEDELDGLRRAVGSKPTLFLGRDDHITWWLRGVRLGTPLVAASRPPIVVGTRPEKIPMTNEPVDFDSIDAPALDKFTYAITPRSGYDSDPPPNFARVRSGRLYELWRRSGATPPRETLEAGNAPGALLDCRRARGREISRSGGSARVWATPRVVKGGEAIAPGAAADLAIGLAPGRWVLSLQYTSSTPVRAVSRQGTWTLPANTARPGPYFTLGEIGVAASGPVGVRMIAEQSSKLGSRGFGLRIGALAATRAGGARELPLRRACGRYVDWYRAG